jgi:two-component system nitrogen regulation sensor histidine kinase NtrY
LTRVLARLFGSRFAGRIAIALAVAAVASSLATYVQLTGGTLSRRPTAILVLLFVDLVLLLLLGGIVAWRIVQLWVERRRGSAGAKLHVRLVALFSTLAALPAVVVAGFSLVFFEAGLQAWFSERVRSALKESLAVAESYLEEHRNTIRADILAMATDIDRADAYLSADRSRLEELVALQTALRNLNEAVIFGPDGRAIVRAGLTSALADAFIPEWALSRAIGGDVVVFDPDAGIQTSGATSRVRALMQIGRVDGLFLLVGRYVDERAVAHVDRTRDAVASYEAAEGRRSGIQITFALVFVVVAVLLLLAAVWVGLLFANRLVRPIGDLIGASERVRTGDLSARVEEGRDDDEIATLSRAFNRMTSQLAGQRRELIEANRQIDERRLFIEAVLAGVSAGVVGLDAEGRIDLPNRSASSLLGTDLDLRHGVPLAEVMPESAALIAAAQTDSRRMAEGAVAVTVAGRKRNFHIRVAASRLETGAEGYVVTFDDITELETAQRKAAWADVARRIAHEIKNPLTPIQLSAERLKRKYLAEIRSDPETFRICTETIVRQVGDIGRMVDEFSSFARMPMPVMRDEDLRDLVRQSVFLQRDARPEITIETHLPEHAVRRALDARQIGQAITNLLQNAVDAIQGRDPDSAGAALQQGHIVVRLVDADDSMMVIVDDNGRGLVIENRERLTEPYVTTRAKGTGLGLAIVKKIMEDHQGAVRLEDGPLGGARAILDFGSSSRVALTVEQDSKTAHGA